MTPQILAGKVVLVTGAGSGIGKATALQSAAAGARVGVLTHTAKEARETCREITNAGLEAIALVADTTDEPAMKRVYATLKKPGASSTSWWPTPASTGCGLHLRKSKSPTGTKPSASICTAPSLP